MQIIALGGLVVIAFLAVHLLVAAIHTIFALDRRPPLFSVALMGLVVLPWSLVVALTVQVRLLPNEPDADFADIREINRVAKALQSYAEIHGEYPPDFSSGDVRGEIEQHMALVFPGWDSSRDMPIDIADLGPHNALEFWLRGFYSDSEFPMTGRPIDPQRRDLQRISQSQLQELEKVHGPIYYESIPDPSPSSAGQLRVMAQIPDSRSPFYEFPLRNLNMENGLMIGLSAAPLIYFRNGNYENAVYEPPKAERGTARPYLAAMSQGSSYSWVNPNSFQLIAAGSDGHYGDGTAILAGAAYLHERHTDNLTNFSGSALGYNQAIQRKIRAIRTRNISPFLAIVCTLMYPVFLALRHHEDGLVILGQMFRKQWNSADYSETWRDILSGQKAERRQAALTRLRDAAGPHTIHRSSREVTTLSRKAV